ncbi:hypothetical protein QQS21_004903 [Conoideocrella luteorostrata]|uniref:Uncharacterized protein n=1 Tax=Conoideocrella luteorostrata TaxID=1105319 RepID=A0AAJ0CQE3_9HYPO|nr:hypothetical protein QQS21_004903 [Conoideocrella luteorostrata]
MARSRWDMRYCTLLVVHCHGKVSKQLQKRRDGYIEQKKLRLPATKLYEGLSDEFATYINYTRSLGFNDRPDYAYLRQLFRRAFSARGFKDDDIFDRTERLFHEMYGNVEKKNHDESSNTLDHERSLREEEQPGFLEHA